MLYVSSEDLSVCLIDLRCIFPVCFFLSAEVTANMSASEETLSWLLDIVENDSDPYVRSV